MLKLQKLTKAFGPNVAVDSADVVVDRPAMIGIIGRSGAGKSTLLRMLNCLTEATSGQILQCVLKPTLCSKVDACNSFSPSNRINFKLEVD
ncbi:MAG: ATP-binding cassette domain-containing protein, partial [Pseudomonadota bacterium]|nr:ATP-binding cassette domain-containing protein [Pseudomonadota bacterium]